MVPAADQAAFHRHTAIFADKQIANLAAAFMRSGRAVNIIHLTPG